MTRPTARYGPHGLNDLLHESRESSETIAFDVVAVQRDFLAC